MSARPVPARKHSAVWYLFAAVLGWAVVLSLFANTLHPAVLRRDAARAPPAERGFGDACRQLPDLGFNYPPLRPVRRMLEALACEPPVSRSVVAAAYRAALLQVDPGAPVNPAAAPLAPMGAAGPSQGRAGAGAGDSAAASTADGSSAAAHLQRFLSLALAHVAADGHVLACALDPSLLEAALGSSSGGGGGGSASSKRVLFAANLSNSGVLAPNLIVQLLRLALLLPPGQLGVSIYESGSSDLTRQWLSLLRMLLLPLGVPHNVTLGGALRPQAGGARVEFLAALRNAALEPFLPHAVPAAAHNAAWPEAGAEGASDTEGSAGGGEWLPEVVVFANDVFFCAGDALRLLTHDADLACGLDFYTGAWQLQGAGGGGSDGSGGGGRGGGDAEAGAVEEDEDDVTLLHQLGEREQGASSDGDGDGSAAAPGRRRAARRLRLARRLATREARLQAREEALGEDSMRQGVLAQRRAARQLQQEEGPAKGQLRFYDKVGAAEAAMGTALCLCELNTHNQPTGPALGHHGSSRPGTRTTCDLGSASRNTNTAFAVQPLSSPSGSPATSLARGCATCRPTSPMAPRAPACLPACPSPRPAAGTASRRCARRRCCRRPACASARSCRASAARRSAACCATTCTGSGAAA